MTDGPAAELGAERRSGPDIAGLMIAAALLALAAVTFWDAAQVGGGATYSRVGPETAAKIAAIGLAVLGVLNGILAWRGGFVEAEAFDLTAVVLIVSGFAALIAIISLGGGFIPGMTVIFAATSSAFGRRTPLLDILIGFVLAVLVYLAFTKLLTLSLPAGPLERLL